MCRGGDGGRGFSVDVAVAVDGSGGFGGRLAVAAVDAAAAALPCVSSACVPCACTSCAWLPCRLTACGAFSLPLVEVVVEEEEAAPVPKSGAMGSGFEARGAASVLAVVAVALLALARASRSGGASVDDAVA